MGATGSSDFSVMWSSLLSLHLIWSASALKQQQQREKKNNVKIVIMFFVLVLHEVFI